MHGQLKFKTLLCFIRLERQACYFVCYHDITIQKERLEGEPHGMKKSHLALTLDSIQQAILLLLISQMHYDLVKGSFLDLYSGHANILTK